MAVTKRRRTPLGTEPPPNQTKTTASRFEGTWPDGSWLDGTDDDHARVEANLARGSKPPRAITSEPTGEAAGTIDTDAKFDLHDVDARVEAHAKAIAQALEAEHEARAKQPADEDRSVIVDIDDEWLARLDLPSD